MEIEIRMKDGRVKRVTLPNGASISTDQLKIMVRWQIAGKSPDLLVD